MAPLFYRNRNGFMDVRRHVIVLNGSFFNTRRMLQQYVLRAYFGQARFCPEVVRERRRMLELLSL